MQIAAETSGYVDQITATIAHEIGRLLGYEDANPREIGGVLSQLAATYYSTYGGGDKSTNLTVTFGSHNFQVNGIDKYKWTEWYVTEVYQGSAQNDYSGYWKIDPEFTYNFTTSNRSAEIKAIVYNDDYTVRHETHKWTVTADRDPSSPGQPTASEITRSSAKISWAASSDADGDTITYELYYARAFSGDTWTSAGSTNSTSRTIAGLAWNQNYSVRVVAHDGHGGEAGNTNTDAFQD